MLKVGVRHKRNHRVENCRGSDGTTTEFIERHPGLKNEHRETKDEERGIENQQRGRVLLPIHRTAIEPVFEKLEETGRLVGSVHDPRQVLAERNGQKGRDQENQRWNKPDLHRFVFLGSVQRSGA